MKKSTFFIFGCLLSITILIVPFVFEMADACRGFDATGAEVFMLALPLGIAWTMIVSAEQEVAETQEENKALKKKIKEQKAWNEQMSQTLEILTMLGKATLNKEDDKSNL